MEGANWSTYPSIPKTASINGFADRIYDQLPACAQPCVRESTGSTPCPYWDTGCLCIMPQFAGAIGNCVAENCQGQNVVQFESLATSICSSAGVWEPYWMPPASVTTALSTAAAAAVTAAETTTASTQEEDTTSAPAPTSASETTVAAESSAGAAAETSAPETTVAAESSAPAEPSVAAGESSAAESSAEEQTSSSSAAPAEGESEGEGESASEHSVATVNGGVVPGVAMGGVIAALAAMI
ncbi:hypothetical protein KGF57_002123 [Candida theae]|uniref:CFEM domain-containing protein n=1 Tax=Candida theae TaxID=1198502 RepID=A0AAD5FZ53_9ASCO|nr:uncharacterized protein KGF57_002123 [Candida theae]KAI5959347.1 hypothetical protein KGF57_002123 [Candida theae]